MGKLTGKVKKASLAEEIQQARPFEGVQQEAYLSILRTAAELSRQTAVFLKDYGLTAAQFNVLRILRGAGVSGLCRHEIAERMVTAMPDVSRLLDRMEKLGWIARERSAKDRREVSTVITPAGLEKIAGLDKPMQRLHEKQFDGVEKGKLKKLAGTMATIRERVS